MHSAIALLISFVIDLRTAGGLSNAGKTFVQTFNYNAIDPGISSTHYFIISTESPQCLVTVTVDAPPKKQYQLLLNNSQALVYKIDAEVSRGVKLEAPCDFVVYGLNVAQKSADGWLALPVEALSNEYVVLGVELGGKSWATPYGPTQLSIVAANDNTKCTSIFPNGTSHVSNLNSIDVDYMTSDIDFTGTRITCNDKVSVLTGIPCAYVVSSCGGCDHMVEQVPPKSTLGRNFALIPLSHACARRPTCCQDPLFCAKCYEIFRILAAENNTVVQWNGTQTVGRDTLQAGQSRYVLLPQSEVAHLVSSKPILVGHYFNSQEYQGADVGDPSFAIVAQLESYWHKYQAATCFPQFKVHYVNLVLKRNTSPQLLLNGRPFLNPDAAIPIPNTDYDAFKFQFDCSKNNNKAISFTLEHSQQKKFGLLAYGFNEYMSYGYPGGMRLEEDVFYTELKKKCLPPRVELTSPSATLASCNVSSVRESEFEQPSIWSDDDCCQKKSILTFVDSILESTSRQKKIRRVWTLVDGCSQSVNAVQEILIKQQLDVYAASELLLGYQGGRSLATGEPILLQNCFTTKNLQYTDETDKATFVIRTWTITHHSNETTVLKQVIRFGCVDDYASAIPIKAPADGNWKTCKCNND